MTDFRPDYLCPNGCAAQDALGGALETNKRLREALERIASPGWMPRPEDFMSVVEIARAALGDKAAVVTAKHSRNSTP